MGRRVKSWLLAVLKDWKAAWSLVLTVGTIITLAVNREGRLHALEANCESMKQANIKQDERMDVMEKGIASMQDTLIVVTNDMGHIRHSVEALNNNVLRAIKPIF